MTVFAMVDAEGFPTSGGRVPAGVALPTGAIALPQGRDVGDLRRIRWTGTEWVERPVVVPAPPSAEELAEREAAQLRAARDEALARVNALTASFRLRFVTDIPGQDGVYQAKRAEALAYVRQAEQSGEPETLEDYPFLAGEVGITAPTAWQLAQIWLFLADRFTAIGAATETHRMQATIAITTAPDYAALERIVAEFSQTLQSLKP